jgi:putative endonuclease
MERSFHVYILSNRRRGVLYVGITSNIEQRIAAHKGKVVPGFTQRHGVTSLVYVEHYASVHEARAREAVLKRWRRQWKFDLIETLNPEWKDLAEQIAC